MLTMKKWRKYWCMVMVILLVIAVVIPISPVVVYAADDYDDLREKYKIKLTGYDPVNPYDINDQYIKISLDNLNDDVSKYLSTMNSSYCWDDVMDSSATAANDVNKIISRLKTMAMGWATYGCSAYYGNATLLNSIINGLEWFYNNRYNENTTWYSKNTDWWYWEIGIPNDLNDIVVLLYDQLTPLQVNNYMKAVDLWSPNVYYSTIIKDGTEPHPFTGANIVSKCKVVGLRAILVKDTVKLQESSVGLNNVFQYTTSLDGFYTDGSFIQHEDHPYAGGSYGTTALSGISEMLWILAGSAWDNTSDNKAHVYEWVSNTYEPAMLEGEAFSSVRGRDISRPPSQASTGFSIISSMTTLSEISATHANDLKSMVKYYLQNGYQDSYLRTCGIWYLVKAKDILNNTQLTPAAELTGNYQFYNEDRVMHRSQEWAFNVAMHSTRIANYESFNGENLKGWYTGDGMTYLYTNPSDYAFNFWPTVDPYRLPGTTVDRDTSLTKSSSDYRSPNPWAGGVSLGGMYGSAGMDFKQHNSPSTPKAYLSAKKSWFMFDDEIVSLGAGINSTSGRIIETVVDNRSINSQGNNLLTVNGTTKSSSLGWSETMDNVNWIHLDGTGGYVFPGGASVKGLRERREGNYYDINQLYYNKANDEFDTTAQGSAWMWVREDSDKHSLSGTTLDITTQYGNLEGSVNTTKNIMLAKAPQYDFYSETKLDFSPSVLGQKAGLIFYVDDDNYVYISRVYSGSGLQILTVSENGGTAVRNTFNDTYGTTVYFKIEKCGSNYILYASSDGQAWGTALYAYSNNMAGTDGVNSDLMMGLFAQNGNNASAPEINASFDYFHLKLVRNYVTLWEDHGVNPVDDSYSYITLPNKTAQEVSSYSNDPDVSILRNDKTVQAVKEDTLGIIGANFWSPGSVSYITAYDQAAVMVKDQNNQLEIAVSDPTHNQSRSAVKVEFCKSGLSVVNKDSTVTVLQMSPTIILEVDISGADATKGKTHNITISYDPLAPTLQPRTMVQLKPAADAYVKDSFKDSNYGTSTAMAVYNTGVTDNGNCEAYIKFDLNSIDEDLVIESAKLYFLGAVSDSSGTEADVQAYSVDNDSWFERTITWNNKPTAGTQLGSMHADGQNEWKEIDVTSYVQSQYAGDKVVSISLAQAQTGLYTMFYSKEYSSYPYLVITAAYPAKLINPEADAFVWAGTDTGDNNYGNNTIMAVKNSSNAAYDRQAYLKFDLSSIEGEIASAKLYMYGRVNDAGGTEFENKVYSVDNDSWAENTITWNTKPSAAGYLSTVKMTSQWGWREFDVTSYVQAQNEGDKKVSFAVLQDSELGLYTEFNSKENSIKKPCLEVVVYKKVNVDLAVEADAFVKDGADSGINFGSNTNLEVKKSTTSGSTRQAYLKFDLSSLGSQIESAKLCMYGVVSDAGGTEIDNKAYSVNDDSWIENGITWDIKPAAGEYLSTVHMTSQWAWREFDVTAYVRAQCESDKKASFVVLQDAEPAGLYTYYRSKEYTSNRPYLKVTYLIEP